jgi:GNAT superfamily N-acetyltransferase
MALDLADDGATSPPDAPAGFRLEGLADLAAVAEASAASTPVGHPDHGSWAHFEERLNYWRRLGAGEVCGPVLNASGELRDGGERVVGALVVTRMPPATWWMGGAWIAEVFVIPDYQGRGLGKLLVTRAIEQARRAEELLLGLTVTEGNPAEGLYHRLGFRRIRTVYVLDAIGAETP